METVVAFNNEVNKNNGKDFSHFEERYVFVNNSLSLYMETESH